jgi:hypothetical protein
MWKLTARGERGTPFNELGDFASINDAAREIIKTEGGSAPGGVFFRLWVDPLVAKSNDAAILSRLEYQSGQRFYLLTRQTN